MRSQRIFSKMKRIEIVVEPDQVETLVKLIERHSTGYTLVPGATGLGEHGYRDKDMVLLVTVVTPEHMDAIIEAILPSLNEHANIVLITEVAVLRAEHFIPEVRSARRPSHV